MTFGYGVWQTRARACARSLSRTAIALPPFVELLRPCKVLGVLQHPHMFQSYKLDKMHTVSIGGCCLAMAYLHTLAKCFLSTPKQMKLLPGRVTDQRLKCATISYVAHLLHH